MASPTPYALARRPVAFAALAGSCLIGIAFAQDAVRSWDVHSTDRPQPPVVTPGTPGTTTQPGTPPSDAIVLIGPGAGLDAWDHQRWTVEDGGVVQVKPGTGDNRTKASFGDCQVHLEWMIPEDRECNGQAGCNSGIFFVDGRYEVQILGSNANETYPDGQAGSLYGQYPPLANPCRPNGQWNVFDIMFTAPRFDGDTLVAPATTTVIFNGVVVQDHVEFMGITAHGSRAKYAPHPSTGFIKLQDHGDPIKFANMWVRPLPDRAPAW